MYLNVPYSEKEEAKKLGAKWNLEKKKWYYNGKTFTNFCEHCNALQGNNFLFHEVDSPFELMECRLEENIEKVKNLKIKKIKLENNIPIDFSFGFSGEEYLYLKYGNIEEIKL